MHGEGPVFLARRAGKEFKGPNALDGPRQLTKDWGGSSPNAHHKTQHPVHEVTAATELQELGSDGPTAPRYRVDLTAKDARVWAKLSECIVLARNSADCYKAPSDAK